MLYINTSNFIFEAHRVKIYCNVFISEQNWNSFYSFQILGPKY